MDFIFAEGEAIDRKNLCQGDLVEKTSELRSALAEAHEYYAASDSYSCFMVLTQSCDLVRRKGKCKSQYITIAAARPLKLVVERILTRYNFELDFPIKICDKQRELLVRQSLERLLHYSEDEYFFIRKGSHPKITEDLCVFLKLSIALRVSHYDTLLSAKISQLADVFQAKVGWLTGNIYSRVGTPDLEQHVANPDKYKRQFYQEALYTQSAWLTKGQFDRLKRLVADWQADHPGQTITEEVAKGLLRSIPPKEHLVVDSVINRFRELNIIVDDETASRAKTGLINDEEFRSLLRTSA